jgi:glycosyltransferase involved in cell wall biosynthesis
MNVCMLAYAHYINDARIKNYVRALEDQGHTVDVIALKSDGESSLDLRPGGTTFRIMEKYQGNSTLRYALSYLKFFLKSAWLLTRRTLSRKYDVVHVHNMPNVLVFATVGAKLRGAGVMLDVHDLMPVNYMAKFGAKEGALPLRILNLEQRISAMFAKHIFCADHNQKDYLIEHCAVAENKITVLMNLPNVEIFKPIKVEKSDDVFRIVYHGTIAHRLGIDLIVRAMAKVRERIPAKAYIYGCGDFLADAMELSSKLGLEQNVYFSKSFFPVEKIPEIVCPMDLGIIGNRRNLACDKYMLPVKLLEYVYLGVPVVAPRLGIISRYFDDSMIRFYEPENVDQMAEAIVSMYDETQRKRFATGAKQFYEKHNIKAQTDLYLDRLAAPASGLRSMSVQNT